MLRKLLFALPILALATYCSGQEPLPEPVLKITEPQSLAIGDLAVVLVDGTSNVQDPKFTVVPAPINPADQKVGTDEKGRPFVSFVCGADQPEGGAFTVVVSANLNGKTVTESTTVTFAKPEPPPPPGPTPTPTPPPVASALWIVVLDDAAVRTDAQTKVLSDLAYWRNISVAGHKFAQVEVADAGAAAWKKALPAGVTAPAVFFQDATTNKLLEAVDLPASEAELTAIIAKLTGKTP